MLIDTDHMSARSLADAFQVTQASGYPMISGHNTYASMIHETDTKKVDEMLRTDAQVQTIFSRGGISAVGIHDIGPAGESLRHPLSRIANDCSGTDKIWYQHYVKAVELQGGWGVAKVPLASDQGLTEMLGPRFGAEACPGGTATERYAQGQTKVAYPFEIVGPGPTGSRVRLGQDRTGATRSFDYNTEGLAHIGLYPDFVQDVAALLKAAGDDPNEKLAPLFRGAEGYIEMWEKATRTDIEPMPRPAPPRTMMLQVQSGMAPRPWVSVTAVDSQTKAAVVGHVSIGGGTQGHAAGPTGQHVVVPTCREKKVIVEPNPSGHGSTRHFELTDVPCTGHVSAEGYTTAGFGMPRTLSAPPPPPNNQP
jgi:hypothetical protein